MIKLPKDQEGSSTPYENFLYLLAEMELAVQRRNIEWPTDQGEVILIRLARVARKVALECVLHDRERPN
jgi:hypothetical protein